MRHHNTMAVDWIPILGQTSVPSITKKPGKAQPAERQIFQVQARAARQADVADREARRVAEAENEKLGSEQTEVTREPRSCKSSGQESRRTVYIMSASFSEI